MGDHAIVHKPNRLYRMIFVGPPDEYIVEGVPADEGSISARGAISIGSFQYYMGRTNFYRLGSHTEPIGDAIWPEIAACHRLAARASDLCLPAAGVGGNLLEDPHARLEPAEPDGGFNYRDQTWTLTDHDPGTCFSEVPVRCAAGHGA